MTRTRSLILVGIDRAIDVERAMTAAFAADVARDAAVHVVHAVPDGSALAGDRLRPWRVDDELGAAVRARVRSVVHAAGRPPVPVHALTMRGTPEGVLAAYAELLGASLLVVDGAYGSAAAWRHGRAVEALVRLSPVPVLVVPAAWPPGQRRDGWQRIVAAADDSVASAVAVQHAADLAARAGARLTLAHALTDVPSGPVFSGSEAWSIARRVPGRLAAAAAQLRRTAAGLGVAGARVEVATGDPGRAIRDIAAGADADVVVIGVPRRSWLDRLVFGSTLRAVLRRAFVPVLVVPVVAGALRRPDAPVIEDEERLAGLAAA